MVYEFAKYPDDTLVVFSDIRNFQIIAKWKIAYNTNDVKFYC